MIPFYKFALIVTGTGERAFLDRLFRSIASSGRCTFIVQRQIVQRSPVTSAKRILRMVGKKQSLPTKDEEEISIPVRTCLQHGFHAVVLIDDLENDRVSQCQEIFQRYRNAMDLLLKVEQRTQVSVHFLVNMLEAYYLADSKAVNSVLKTNLHDHVGDVEEVPHPKNYLKKIADGKFNEVSDGQEIIKQLDVEYVLSRPETCAALRTLFAWCCDKIREPRTEKFQLVGGKYHPVTSVQLQPSSH